MFFLLGWICWSSSFPFEFHLCSAGQKNFPSKLAEKNVTNKFSKCSINLQLSPEGEVNNGGYTYTETRSVEVYIHHSSPTLRGIVVLVFTKSGGQKNAASLMATISSSETFARRRAIFLSVPKTVNIQGYSKLREPIKTRENCYLLIW